MLRIDKHQIRKKIIEEKQKKLAAEMSRGETPTFGLSIALQNPAINLATARANWDVLQDAEDFRNNDEVSWGGCQIAEKRRRTPAALTVYEICRYLDAEDYSLAEEAIESMICFLWERARPVWQNPYKPISRGHSPRVPGTALTYEAVLELGNIVTDAPGGHGRAHGKVLHILDPASPPDRKLLRWSEWCGEIMDDLERVVIGHTQYDEDNVIGELGKNARYRTVEWLPHMSGGLYEISSGENYYTFPRNGGPAWACNDCGGKLADNEGPKSKAAGRIILRDVNCPVCRRPHSKVRFFKPFDVGKASIPMVHDYSCRWCYAGVDISKGQNSMGAAGPPASRKSPHPNIGWCETCADYTAARHLIKKRRSTPAGPWTNPQKLSMDLPGEFLFNDPTKEGDPSQKPGARVGEEHDYESDDTAGEYRGREDKYDQLAEVHALIADYTKRKDKRNNMGRVAWGLIMNPERIDTSINLSRVTIAKTKRGLEEVLEPWARRDRKSRNV